MTPIETDKKQFRLAFYALALLWLAILVFFHFFPGLDIAVSAHFFEQTRCSSPALTAVCGVFPLGGNSVLATFREVAYYVPPLVVVAMLAFLIGNRNITKPASIARSKHKIKLLTATWLFNVVVIVNLLFKAHSARPRPASTTLFGGSETFVPAGDFSGTCQSNCSFVSGEAASAGWLMCLIFLVPTKWRARAFMPFLTFSLATAFLRVGFGRHFLSDAILGWLSSPVIFALALALFGWEKTKKHS